MKELTQADIDETIQALKDLQKELKGNPELAEEVLGWVEDRPEVGLSPNERYENLIESFGHVKPENALSQ